MNKSYSKSESEEINWNDISKFSSVIPVLVLGISLGSGSWGNRHFRFLMGSDVSWSIFLRLLDTFFLVVKLLYFLFIDRDERILFPSETLASIILKIII